MKRTILSITLTVLFVCCSKPEVNTSGDDPAINEEPDKTETFISIEPASLNVPSRGGIILL